MKELGQGAYKGAFRAAEENYFTALTNYVTKRFWNARRPTGRPGWNGSTALT
jgi:hypothetical protein